jgi:hypothetical protein
MAAMKTLLALALAGTASAVCPNACSGHGTCGADDVCQCYQNWGMADEKSGDCSEMYCPFEYAWVDTPDADGNFHKYAECSGKGICDRSTGECECFDGYTGKGCQRMTCPNDCSGHGTCEYIEELPFAVVPGTYQGNKYIATDTMGGSGYGTGLFKTAFTFAGDMDEIWDYHKSMACVCDPGYIELDCSRRMCPKSNDVMDERLNTADIFNYQIQNITFYSAGTSGNGSFSTITEFYDRSFALTFVSTLNESFTTIPIMITYSSSITDTEIAMGAAIELALQALPNKVITNVNVNVSFGYETRFQFGTSDTVTSEDLAFMHMDVEFVGDSVMGPQNLLIPETDKCWDGCTPMITGLDLLSTTSSQLSGTYLDLSFVAEKQAADYNNYECGRRGKCDYDSGLCECFEGYTGEACSTQTALV